MQKCVLRETGMEAARRGWQLVPAGMLRRHMQLTSLGQTPSNAQTCIFLNEANITKAPSVLSHLRQTRTYCRLAPGSGMLEKWSATRRSGVQESNSIFLPMLVLYSYYRREKCKIVFLLRCVEMLVV